MHMLSNTHGVNHLDHISLLTPEGPLIARPIKEINCAKKLKFISDQFNM
jgi:hypothetical protein